MKPRQVPAIVPDECFKHLLEAKSAILELRQISQQPVEETQPWTSLTKEKQRELQLLANSTRMQVQKSVRDLTSEIRQLRQTLDTSQRYGEDLQSVDRIVAQDSVIPTVSPRSGLSGSHRQRLAPEALPHNSIFNAEEPKEISALSDSVAQSGQSKIERNLHTDRAGRPTVASQQRSRLTLLSNGRSKRVEVSNGQRKRESVARKCEACRRQVLEPGSLCETAKRHSSDHRQSHCYIEAQPSRKKSVVCAKLVGCTPSETSPTAEWVPSNHALPREQHHRLHAGNYVRHCLSNSRQQNGLLDVKNSSEPWASGSRKQGQGLNEITMPRAKPWEAYLETTGRKEIQEQNRHDRHETMGGILQKDTEHPGTGKRPGDLQSRNEKKFVEAVENYFVKLMKYEEKVLRRWFPPSGESQSPERKQFTPKLQHSRQEWVSPDQLHQSEAQKHAHSSELRNLTVQQESSIAVSLKSLKQGQFNSAENVTYLRELQKCNEDGSHFPNARSSRRDKKLGVLTTKQVDFPGPRHKKVAVVEHSREDNLSSDRLPQTALVAVDHKGYKKSIMTIRLTAWVPKDGYWNEHTAKNRSLLQLDRSAVVCQGAIGSGSFHKKIAESLLDEALTQLAWELRTWCGKVVDYLIDGELGTNTP